MNGESAFGWIKAAGALLTLAVLGFLAWKAYGYFQSRGVLGSASDLKEKTPLGVPARVIDSAISAATGREETLGGWLAELLDPMTRKANAMLGTPAAQIVKPKSAPVTPPSVYAINPRDRN